MSTFVIRVDKLPLPSKFPTKLVCHWLNGSVMSALSNRIHEPPAQPLVADIDNDEPLKLIAVKRGEAGRAGAKTAATKAFAVGLGVPGSVQAYWMVSAPALNPDK